MGRTVLIVDDEPDILQIISESLEEFELSSRTAGDGGEALVLLQKHPDIGLVITDWKMDEMNGDELIMRMAERGIRIPSIVISGFSPVTDQGVREAGAVALYTKPLDLMGLCERAASILAEREGEATGS